MVRARSRSKPRNSTVETIAQRVHPVDRDKKSRLLAWLVGHHRWQQVLVFTRTKHGADKLVTALGSDGIRALALHGNKSQNARTHALAEFKKGNVKVMVATDIAARGLDIDQLPHVVNYDLPNVPEDYVHRIGRTGRAGANGEAISLVCVDEHAFLRDIERLIRRPISREVIAGFEPDPHAIAQNIFTRGRGQPQPQWQRGSGSIDDGRRHAAAPLHGKPRTSSHASAHASRQGERAGASDRPRSRPTDARDHGRQSARPVNRTR